MKLRKYQVKALMKVFETYGCKTINDVLELLDKELINDTDVVLNYGVKKNVTI